MPRTFPLAVVVALFLGPTAFAETPTIRSLHVDPPALKLSGPVSGWSILVSGTTEAGQIVDLTSTAEIRAEQPERVNIVGNLIRGKRDGQTRLVVTAGGKTALVPVEITGSTTPRTFHFENDISPILGRHGCSGSGCHGKAEGQGGFKLSVFGFDPVLDHTAIVKEARGRRVFPAAPETSLILTKASGQAAHGGGTRIKPETDDYETLRGWIAAGLPVGESETPHVSGLRVEPTERLMTNRANQQLRVIATYSDGREADVTRHARFSTNNEIIATVTASGLVTTVDAPGEVAVMAAYLGEVGLFRAMIPRPGEAAKNTQPRFNRVDELVDRKLAKLNISPSGLCDDSEFLRRVTLDLTGLLPTSEDARKFLADTDPKKREKLVETLLKRPAFADLMALKWADVLRVERNALGPERAYAYYKWLRDGFAANKPFDQIAKELLVAEGPLSESPPANFYKVVTKPGEMASTLSQVFLGVRITCAECHHHPFDRWSQTDYYGMVAYFAPVAARGQRDLEAVFSQGNPDTKHPRTGETVVARPLGVAPPAENPTGDRRVTLAEWMTDAKNPFFARNLANRVWAHLLGRGLVEPVDDVRATNPPTNPELLDHLAAYLVEHQFDVQALVRHITASRVYQTTCKPNATNDKDETNYSRYPFKRLDAEVLLDIIGQSAGVPERFRGVPAGTRAVQLWDSKTTHEFLKLFGRPTRASACECERNHEPSVSQVLNLLNSPLVQAKLNHEAGTVAKLTHRFPENKKLVEELYLTFYARYPTATESDIGVSHLNRYPDARRRAAEDIAWAMLNSLEFGFNH